MLTANKITKALCLICFDFCWQQQRKRHLPVWCLQPNIVDVSPGIHVLALELVKDKVCQMHVFLASCCTAGQIKVPAGKAVQSPQTPPQNS